MKALDVERKLRTCAERAWRLAIDIAMEGARLGDGGRGLGIVADESRRISLELETALGGDGDWEALGELARQLGLLALNGSIEALHAQAKSPEAASVNILLGELRSIMGAVEQAIGVPAQALALIPEPSKPHPVCKAKLYLLHAERAGLRFAENIEYVKEIVRYDGLGEEAACGKVIVRGDAIPIADLARGAEGGLATPALGGEKSLAVIVRCGWTEPAALVAVPVDALAPNCIARCILGASEPFSGTRLAGAFVRDAWAAPEGQVIFPDWLALASR